MNDTLVRNFLHCLKGAKQQFEFGVRSMDEMEPVPEEPIDMNANIERMKRDGERADAAHSHFNNCLYECTRAHRISKDAPDVIAALGVNTEEFNSFMDRVRKVRNVQEHWMDVKGPRQPKSHTHEGGNVRVDETSLIYITREKVLIGDINVFDAYDAATAILTHVEGQRT